MTHRPTAWFSLLVLLAFLTACSADTPGSATINNDAQDAGQDGAQDAGQDTAQDAGDVVDLADVTDDDADVREDTDAPLDTTGEEMGTNNGAVDMDEDGYDADVDCNDDDANIHPGAMERCNGIDDDCDMEIDEGSPTDGATRWFADSDEDGYGDSEASVVACQAPAQHVALDGDCDDTDATINPDAQEICDGVDNDCVGGADNGVINDGDGCVDPGYPETGPVVRIAQLTIRNGNNAGDDGVLEFVLNGREETYVAALNNVSWDDHMRNTVDVYTMELGNSRIQVDGLGGRQSAIRYDDSDAWEIGCTELSINGVVVHCDEYVPALRLERNEDEAHVFTLTDPIPAQSLPCTCYDGYLTHGPVVGATGPDRTRIWGRSDATRRVVLTVGTDPDNRAVVAYRYPVPANDNTFEFDVFGLEPSTRYSYGLELDGETTVGTFTTAPAAGAAGTFTFAAGSCTKTTPWRHPEQRIFAAIGERQPDMMWMLGDNLYFDSLTLGDAPDLGAMRSYYRDALQRRGSWAEPHYPPIDVYDPYDPGVRPLPTSRARWWGSFGRDDRADLFAVTPTLAIWDDHDFYTNNADAFYDDNRGRKPWTRETIQVFDEYWPNPDGGLSDVDESRMGIYFKQSWGDVDIFGLDTRFQRDDSRERMLGRAQMDWLKAGLSSSEATFKIILSGSIFAGSTDDDEKWPHFVADLAELYNHIWNGEIGGVVLMSGDIHISAVLPHRNPRNPNDPYIIYEIITSPLANYGPNSSNPSDYGSLIQMRYLAPFDYDRKEANAFALIEIDTTAVDPTLSVRFIDEYGGSACVDCPFEVLRSQLGPR